MKHHFLHIEYITWEKHKLDNTIASINPQICLTLLGYSCTICLHLFSIFYAMRICMKNISGCPTDSGLTSCFASANGLKMEVIYDTLNLSFQMSSHGVICYFYPNSLLMVAVCYHMTCGADLGPTKCDW